jgi:hypothetical protein
MILEDPRGCITIGAHGASDSRCYVQTFQGPRAVWSSWREGAYPFAESHMPLLEDAIRARGIRWGAYGDPGAVPLGLIRHWSRYGRSTGYTHQWRRRPGLRGLMMASVETLEDARAAQARGWRTFRVRPRGEELPIGPDGKSWTGELECPASAEAGHRTKCQACGLCNGAAGSSASSPTGAPWRQWNPEGIRGLELWRGPSRLDGAPIVAIATGLAEPSSNPKTGPMVQTWILRADSSPQEAQRTGADASVCGDCPLRPLLARASGGAR